MIIAVALILLAVFMAPLQLESTKPSSRETDFCSPLRLLCWLHVVTVVPFLIMVGSDESSFPYYARRDLPRLDLGILHYGAVQIVGFIALVAGLSARLPWALVRSFPVIGVAPPTRALFRAGIITLTIGFGAYITYIHHIGGFFALLNTQKARNVLTAGNGYLLALTRLILPGVMALISTLRYRRSVSRVLLAIIAIGTAITALSSVGGRSSTIMLVIVVILTWHYTVRRITRPSLWFYVLALLFIPYFVAIPLLREPGAALRYSEQREQLWHDIRANLYKVVTQLSYVDTYVFIVNHFDTTNLWLGRSYLDLIVAPIPSTIYPEKPPVDDGVYIRSLEEGMTVAPGMPYSRLFKSSTPPETLGLSYLNFWWPGLIIGMYALGAAYKTAYAYMAHSGYSLHSIYVYGFMIFGFQFTNLKIANFTEAVTTSTIALGLLLGFSRVRMHAASIRSRTAPGGQPEGSKSIVARWSPSMKRGT